MKLKINKGMALYYLLVVLFIPPRFVLEIDKLSIIATIFAGCRYVMLPLIVIYFFSQKKDRRYLAKSYLFTYITAVIMQVVALIQNDSFYITAALSCLSFAEFIFANIILYNRDKSKLLMAYRNYLGLCMVLHLLTIVLLPNGITGAATGVSRVYFMGLKNSVTPYAILWLLVFYLVAEERIAEAGKKFRHVCLAAGFATLFSIVNASAAHVGAMVVIDGYLLMTFAIQSNREKIGLFQKIYVIGITLFVIIFFYMVIMLDGGNNLFTEIITTVVGRDVTFSGRRAVWARAISFISKNPLWGLGIDVRYDVWGNNKYVYSAHNMFLDYGVKYGCISLAFSIFSILAAFKVGFHSRKNEKVRMCLIICAALLLASMFEAVQGLYPTWMSILLMYLVSETSKEKQVETITGMDTELKSGKVLAR